jgi:energy-coupling factor transport system permease protein
MAFALLVLSLRRGTKLATAMEARAFGAPGRRTWARVSRFGAAEWSLMAVGLAIALVATAAAVAAGTWNFILGPGV